MRQPPLESDGLLRRLYTGGSRATSRALSLHCEKRGLARDRATIDRRDRPSLRTLPRIPFPQIGHAARDLFVRPAVGVEAWRPGEIHPHLSWTHYWTLLKVEHRDARFLRALESLPPAKKRRIGFVIDDD
jgi:hypothetical protein